MLTRITIFITLLFLSMTTLSSQRCSAILGKEKTDDGYILFLRTESSDANAKVKGIKWSTGSTDEKIKVKANGNYCIRVEFSNGCVAEKCISIEDIVNNQRCSIDFFKEERNGLVFICVKSLNPDDEIKEVHWSNGSRDKCVPYSNSSGELCVKVITTKGCEISKCITNGPTTCTVKIERVLRDGATYLCASPSSQDVKSFQWSNGKTDRCILLPEGQKEICVKAYFENGCIASDCIKNELECGVAIMRKTDDAGNVFLCAESRSNMKVAKFYWSTGDTTACIRLRNDVKEICVKAVFTNGCIATACLPIEPPRCNVEIIRKQNDDGSIYLCAQSSSTQYTAGMRYKWNTGDTTQCIKYDGTVAKYCVTVIFANGCVAEKCFTPEPIRCKVEIIRKSGDGNSILLCADTGPTDEIKRYFWSTGDTTACIKYDPAFVGEICVKVQDLNGCIATDCIVIQAETCKVEIIRKVDEKGNAYLCAVTKPNVTAKFVWNNGTENECTRIQGDGNYCVKAYFDNGCETSACIDVKTDTCRIAIRMVKVEDGYLLSVVGPANSKFKNIQWSNNENSQTVFVAKSGEYCVKVQMEDGCVGTACTKVEIPACWVRIVREGNILYVKYDGVKAPEFEWSTGDKGPKIEITNLVEYCVKMTDQSGCSAFACLNLQPRVGSGIDDKNNGKKDIQQSDRDQNIQVSDLDIFPNPTMSTVNIKTDTWLPGKYNYQIIAIDGRVVQNVNQKTIDENTSNITLDFSDLQNGMYVVKFWSDKNMFASKILKQ